MDGGRKICRLWKTNQSQILKPLREPSLNWQAGPRSHILQYIWWWKFCEPDLEGNWRFQLMKRMYDMYNTSYKHMIQSLLIKCFKSARCAWGKQWRTAQRTFPFNFWNHCGTFRDSVFHSQHENDYHDPIKRVFSLFLSPMNSLD